MTRGPKPKPVELRLIEGNRGKRGIPEDVPQAEGKPVKPAWLKGRAAALWAEYAPQLHWLARVDSEMLAAWCALTAEFQKRPEAMTAARIGQMRTLAAELGMSPSSRTRLGVKPLSGNRKTDDGKGSRYFA